MMVAAVVNVAEELDGAPVTAISADEWRAHWPGTEEADPPSV